jgi:hypothetical protein
MKWTIYFLIILFAFCGSVFADKHLMATETLSVDDVTPYAHEVTGKQPQFEVLGIHQEGNSATVYYKYQKKNFAPHFDHIKLVRFNSGKWFNLEENEFITQK